MLLLLRKKEMIMDVGKFHKKINIVKFLIYLVDAFVALGGNADKSGYVRKSALI